MKQINLNQEILLNSSSSFFKKDYCEQNAKPADKQLSQKEQVVNMCWNGLLPELLPEISDRGTDSKPLPLWEINETQQMLDLRLGEFDENLNDEFSINPYVYLSLKEYN
ncbi:MAG: hypothetical protein EOO06_12320 [Chitinophagaceae bacterium]|nr:MAG: hypothetical protein EOO06_12320 [Chitinophagaceae bacterium]